MLYHLCEARKSVFGAPSLELDHAKILSGFVAGIADRRSTVAAVVYASDPPVPITVELDQFQVTAVTPLVHHYNVIFEHIQLVQHVPLWAQTYVQLWPVMSYGDHMVVMLSITANASQLLFSCSLLTSVLPYSFVPVLL